MIFNGPQRAEGEALSKIRAYLPRVAIFGATLADDEFDAEGLTYSLVWGRFVIQLTFALTDRTGGAPR